jgi:hypothetical protein
MKRAFILSALFCLPACALAGEPGETKGEAKGVEKVAEFTLVNKTGFAIDKIFLAMSGSHDWGGDELGSDQLPNEESAKLPFADLAHCRQDLKAVYADKSSHIWSGVDLCENNKLVLNYDRSNSGTSFKTE